VQIIIPPRRKDDGSLEGSIHEDADDESELSEIDEDAMKSDHEDILMRPMFPGLARHTNDHDENMEDEDEDEDEEEAEEDVGDHDENEDMAMEEAEGLEEVDEEGDDLEQQDEEDIDVAAPLNNN